MLVLYNLRTTHAKSLYYGYLYSYACFALSFLARIHSSWNRIFRGLCYTPVRWVLNVWKQISLCTSKTSMSCFKLKKISMPANCVKQVESAFSLHHLMTDRCMLVLPLDEGLQSKQHYNGRIILIICNNIVLVSKKFSVNGTMLFDSL